MRTKRSACMWSAIPPPTIACALGQPAERSTCLHPPPACGRARAVLPSPSGLLNRPAPSPRDRLTIPAGVKRLTRRCRVSTGFVLIEIYLKSSCADLIRASTSLLRALEGEDAHGTRPWAEGPRDKPGQDEIGGSFCSVIRPQGFPRTALRESGHPGRNPPHSPPCSSQGQALDSRFSRE
jgi:hypothetical protein